MRTADKEKMLMKADNKTKTKDIASVTIPRNVIEELIMRAEEARAYAYAPYSEFRVGAALLTGEQDVKGKGSLIFTGCNVENAAYSPGNCAERTAVFKAVSEGCRSFRAIAIVGGRSTSVALQAEGEQIAGERTAELLRYISPCGMCRQVLREFVCPEEFYVIMANSKEDYVVKTLDELFPMSFGPEHLI